MMERENESYVGIWIPTAKKERLQGLAKAHNRSLSGEIREILNNAVEVPVEKA
jgi:plasmid stability protein